MNGCEKCKELNKKLGLENPKDYEAICDDCWDKRVDDLPVIGDYEPDFKTDKSK